MHKSDASQKNEFLQDLDKNDVSLQSWQIAVNSERADTVCLTSRGAVHCAPCDV